MKKYFCFYCQKDVEPKRLLKCQFCPFCKRLMKDKGEGFYRVCDMCGANMPADADYCLKCGMGIDGIQKKLPEILGKSLRIDGFLDIVFSVFMILMAFLILFGILYASFYVLLIALAIGAVWSVFMSVSRRF